MTAAAYGRLFRSTVHTLTPDQIISAAAASKTLRAIPASGVDHLALPVTTDGCQRAILGVSGLIGTPKAKRLRCRSLMTDRANEVRTGHASWRRLLLRTGDA